MCLGKTHNTSMDKKHLNVICIKVFQINSLNQQQLNVYPQQQKMKLDSTEDFQEKNQKII